MDVRRKWRSAAVVLTAVAGLLLLPLPATATAEPQAGTPATGLRDLGTLGGLTSQGADINARGQVTGFADTAAGSPHAFVWTASGGMQDLGSLGGADSRGVAINEWGQVIGESTTGVNGERHGFVWTATGGMRDAGTLGGCCTVPVAINDRGQVAGYSNLPNDAGVHAFRWTPSGGIRDLGTLGGPTSAATGINLLGQIVGVSSTEDGSTHAFRWTPSGGMQDLGTLGGANSFAPLINELGQVVGTSANRRRITSRVPMDVVRWDAGSRALLPGGYQHSGSDRRDSHRCGRGSTRVQVDLVRRMAGSGHARRADQCRDGDQRPGSGGRAGSDVERLAAGVSVDAEYGDERP